MNRQDKMYQGDSLLTSDKSRVLKTLVDVLLIVAVCLALVIDLELILDGLLN